MLFPGRVLILQTHATDKSKHVPDGWTFSNTVCAMAYL
jgi:hypothetical protein